MVSARERAGEKRMVVSTAAAGAAAAAPRRGDDDGGLGATTTASASISARNEREVDWDRLDKQKFFVYSIAVFSSISACLFPLTVIKTKVMVGNSGGGSRSGGQAYSQHSTGSGSANGHNVNANINHAKSNNSRSGMLGTYRVAQEIVQKEGVAGLYKGFGTVVLGTIPARIVYLSTLEVMKQHVGSMLRAMDASDVLLAGGKNLIAGGMASAMTQMIVV